MIKIKLRLLRKKYSINFKLQAEDQTQNFQITNQTLYPLGYQTEVFDGRVYIYNFCKK